MQIRSGMQRLWRSNGLGWLLGLGVFGYLMAFPQTLNGADESFILYGASRILKGQAIYRDFFEFITPGSFYLFAGVFAIAGPSLLGARAVMAATNALSCVFLFRLTRQVASALEACAAVVVFVVLCLPVWRMASPHWLSTTLCLATATLLLSECWTETARARAVAVGVLAGLTFCTQQHRGVFLTIWVTATIVALSYLAPRALGWRCKRQIAWVALGWLAVTAGILGHAAWQGSLRRLLYATFTFVFRNYFTAVHGTNLSGKVSWAGIAPLTGGLVAATWLKMFELFPWVLVLEALALAWAVRRGVSRTLLVRGAALLLAGLMSVCILYLPDFIHVAFIAPFFLIVTAALVDRLRSLSVWNRPRFLRMAPPAALIVVCAVLLSKGRMNLQNAWRQVPERFETAVGELDSTTPMREAFQTVRVVLATTPSSHKTLFSYPADAWFYLAVPADNPTPFDLLLRGYNTPEQFREAAAALREHPPDGLVVSAVSASLRRYPELDAVLRDYQLAARVSGYEVYVRKPPK